MSRYRRNPDGTFDKVAGSPYMPPNFIGASSSENGEAGLVPAPLAGDEEKVLYGDGSWRTPPSGSGSGIELPETPDGRVYQDDGTFGKRLQVDIVTQNGEYGYIGENDTFIPFKTQADVSAAVSAARVGNATAADVVAGKTFTNNSASGLTGAFEGQEKTVTATDSDITVTPDTGKWLSQVNVKPMNLLSVGKLRPSKNLYAHGIAWIRDDMPKPVVSYNGLYIWTDGTNIYYSDGSDQYVLDKATYTWIAKTWTGLTDFYGDHVWTDGTNIYYSEGSNQYILDKATSTWVTKTWTGLTEFRGDDIWTDGTNFYYSSDTDQYVLDISTSTWSTKSWNGFTSFIGRNIWTDGINIYMSAGPSSQWVLDAATSTWSTKTWTGDMQDINGYDVWTDGINIYNTIPRGMYIYNPHEDSWLLVYEGSLELGRHIWYDGINIRYARYGNNYILTKVKTKWPV